MRAVWNSRAHGIDSRVYLTYTRGRHIAITPLGAISDDGLRRRRDRRPPVKHDLNVKDPPRVSRLSAGLFMRARDDARTKLIFLRLRDDDVGRSEIATSRMSPRA